MIFDRSRVASSLTLVCVAAAVALLARREWTWSQAVELTPALLAIAVEIGWQLVRIRWPEDFARGTNANSVTVLRIWTDSGLLAVQIWVLVNPPLASGIVNVAAGALLVALGNVLPAIRRNAHFGVRTPWTQASEKSWNLTHRALGWTLVVCGISLLIVGVCVHDAPLQPAFSIVVGVVVACAIGFTALIRR